MVTAKATACLFTIQPRKHNRLSLASLLETIQGGAIVNAGVIPFASILGIDKFLPQKNGIRQSILDIRIRKVSPLQAKSTITSFLFASALVTFVKIMLAIWIPGTNHIINQTSRKLFLPLHIAFLA